MQMHILERVYVTDTNISGITVPVSETVSIAVSESTDRLKAFNDYTAKDSWIDKGNDLWETVPKVRDRYKVYWQIRWILSL